MSIVITGAEGFLGQHLMKRLPEAYGVSRRAYDLRSVQHVRNLFNDIGNVDILYHLAGVVGGIESNLKEPGRFFYDNMQMGLNVIHEAMLHNVKKIIMVGTTCSYPKHTPIPFNEKNLFNGYPEGSNSPYGIAKRALYVMLRAYSAQYGLKFCYLIPTNLYGPGDKSDHVIPMLIEKFLNQDNVIIWGTGKPTRDFLYVEDAADALVKAIDCDSDEPINLGTGNETSIFALARIIQKLTGHTGTITFDNSKSDGQPRRCLRTVKAQSLLNWRSITSLEDGLKRTIEWVKSL